MKVKDAASAMRSNTASCGRQTALPRDDEGQARIRVEEDGKKMRMDSEWSVAGSFAAPAAPTRPAGVTWKMVQSQVVRHSVASQSRLYFPPEQCARASGMLQPSWAAWHLAPGNEEENYRTRCD
ncbi:hypothetical protein PT974_06701 [Cladobotryum mycophilum]|uniref:Uncharacterized protein n=1 Tax=Cladobotryum mycophilum TaxID=491253 RepID=A0ABR0SN04_9HYPO